MANKQNEAYEDGEWYIVDKIKTEKAYNKSNVKYRKID